MQIAVNDRGYWEEFMGIINQIAQEHPILVDKYLQRKEVEVDAVCDGETFSFRNHGDTLSRAGDSFRRQCISLSGKSLTTDIQAADADYTRRLAKGTSCAGTYQIQFIVCEGRVYVIEVNPALQQDGAVYK